MQSIFRSSDFKELLSVKQYPEGFAGAYGIRESEYTIDYKGVKEQTKEILLDGILIEQRTVNLAQPLTIQVHHDFPFLKMHFELKGHSSYMPGGKGSLNADIPNGRHRLLFFPEVKGQLNYPTSSRFTLEIKLSLNFFNRIFCNNFHSLKHFGKGVATLQPVLATTESAPISVAMKHTIMEIIHCKYAGMLKKVFLEGKVMELLAMQVEQVNAITVQKQPANLKKDDIEKLHFVKELITKNINEPYSLVQLSEIAGLNNFKLKKGFKELFQNTVFGYLAEVRMERAKTLILEGKQSISDISFMIGYKNPQHFTAAFKKKYGYLPSDLKSNS